MPRSAEQFQTIHTEGAILPPDVLQRIATGELEGLDPTTYHLPSGTKTKEAISQSWTRLLRYWKDFQAARKLILESDETGTLTTREKWLLPLFQELGYGRLTTSKAPEIDGKLFPIERFWQRIPIHLIGCKLQLDHRTKGARGAATAIPHSMVQEFLNRSAEHAWGFLSNGLQLRVLRDSAALSRQSYVEFDLESMMEGEVYADFAILWLTCHQSRLEGDKPEDLWLEKWSKLAQEQGTRILEDLRVGVAKAIESLGRGFISHPRNETLINRLQSGSLTTQDYYRQILRIVYRLLFLFVAEDRGLLHPPTPSEERLRLAHDAARDRYDRFYSLRRLRDLAESYRGSKHSDLWHSLSLLFDALGKPEGCPQLALPAFGSFLWSHAAAPDLSGPAPLGVSSTDVPVFIRNEDLLDAIRALAFVERNRVLRAVNYRNLGSVELGSVYESLLELHPQINIPGRGFALNVAAGNERKTTGSFYTPDPLVQCLLDSALEPVVADAIKGKTGVEAEKAILNLKVCDPAVGSGHFLIAAGHRLARHLARARTGESEPSPQDYQRALRDVIGHCLYGVDLNPMAVELCKISLWMEALESGKPLSFLDHRIVVGNSLLGTTPALLVRGIPDAAFEPIEGDDKAYCRTFKKQNKDERSKMPQLLLYRDTQKPWEKLGNLAASLTQLDALPDDSVTDIRTKEERYADLVKSSTYESGRLLADAWCAAFVFKKTKAFDYPITEKVFRDTERNPHSIQPWMKTEIIRLRDQYQFFHWHLAFPSVFTPVGMPEERDIVGWTGGFDVVLGNPPWEKLQTEELQWFASVRPDIAALPGAARKRAIAALEAEDPALLEKWLDQRRSDAASTHWIKHSGRYPFTGVGKFNSYALFAETSWSALNSRGRVGCILPSGIATDDTTKLFFQELVDRQSIISLFDFENSDGLFPGVHRSFKFCLITFTTRRAGNSRPSEGNTAGSRAAQFAFYLRSVGDLADSNRVFPLTCADISLLNPNTRTCPIFRSRRDASLTRAVYERTPIIENESASAKNAWRATVRRLLNETDDSHNFVRFDPAQQKLKDGYTPGDILPLFEAKYIWQYDHRYATFDADVGDVRALTAEEKSDPAISTATALGVPYDVFREVVASDLPRWWFVFRRITNITNERTFVAAIVPSVALGTLLPTISFAEEPPLVSCFLAEKNSFVFDYITRQKVSGTDLNFFKVKQLPSLPPSAYSRPSGWGVDQSFSQWISARVIELTFTAADMQTFAKDCGYDGPPFEWDEERRFQIRCELDAAYFHLYGIARDDVDYIMETFPIVKRKDVDKHGAFRTKDRILQNYDDMAAASLSHAAVDSTALSTSTLPSRRRINVPTLTACELVVLMLDEWKKPVQRLAADRALVLALNDQVRSQIIAAQTQRKTSAGGVIVSNVNFDTVWKTLQAMNLVTIRDTGASVIISRIVETPLQPTDLANISRAKDAIKAFELIEQRRAAWPTEVDDVEYAFS